MNSKDTTHKDRVNKTIRFLKPDRVPQDFAAVPEIWEKLGEHFYTSDRNEILKKMDVDCRIVSYDSFIKPPDVEENDVDLNASQERSSIGGMWRKVEADGSNIDIWGAHRTRVQNPTGMLDQFASFPLETAQSVDDLKNHNWPNPDWWNFSNIREYIENLNDDAIYNIRYRVGSFFETSWSLYNFEKFLLDLAMNPDMITYMMDRIAEVHLENTRIVLESAADLIDIIYFYDDVASQDALLISPQMYEQFVQPYHQKLIDLAGRFDKPVMMHCCGAVYPLIERFINMGLAVLNPIQPSAKDMNPEKLNDEFGNRIAFHGGIDIQQFLPSATPEQVKEKVEYTKSVLGADGGYILAGSHHIQSDTPIDNILMMYDLLE